MKLTKTLLMVLLAVMVTGCEKRKKHGTDPSTVCRSPKTTIWRDINQPVGSHTRLTDAMSILTGEVNGEEGVTMKLNLCQRDGGGNLVNCVFATSSGSLPGGVIVTFEMDETVTLANAVTAGYARMDLEVFFTCHP